jgi:DNA-binding response OmpR family regulator
VTITLLAIDDSKTMRRVVEITFAGEDFRTVAAEGAADGLTKLQAERPTIALVDAGLAGTSGYDVCQQIKQQAPGTAVIIMSSKQQPYDRTRGTQVGADDFIDKPFDTQQLIDKVIALARRGSSVAAAAPARPPAPAVSSPAPVRAPAPSADAGQRVRVQTLSFGTSSDDILSAPPAAHVVASPAPVVAPTPAPPVARTAPQAAVPPAQPSREPAPVPRHADGDNGKFPDKLAGLGLTPEQVQAVLALSREVVEQVVWEVVPSLAEAMIQEEIKRLTSD